MGAIYKREMQAYFNTGLGYVFCAVFLAVTGFAFSMFTLQNALTGTDINLPTYYTVVIIMLVVLLPILTMKSFAEEKKSKTEQLILTSPVSLGAMVTAKFFAALTVFGLALGLSCVYFTVISLYGSPNFGVLYGYTLGIFFMGAAFIAVGIFISSLTENQLSAAVGTMAVLMIMIAIAFLNSYIDSAFIRSILSWISIYDRFGNFCYGLFDFSALLYYISVCFAFIFLTVRVYEKRRWA